MKTLKARLDKLEEQADPKGERFLSPLRQGILAKVRAAIRDGRLTVDQVGERYPSLAREYLGWQR